MAARGARPKCKIRPMSPSDMKHLLSEEEMEVLTVLNNPGYGFETFLRKRVYTEKDINIAVQLIAKACTSKNPGSVAKLLRTVEVYKDTFLFSDALNVIDRVLNGDYNINLPKLMRDYLIILKFMLKKLNVFHINHNFFLTLQNYANKMRSLKMNVGLIFPELKIIEKECEMHEQLLHSEQEGNGEPLENFRALSIFPRSNDVLTCEKPFLRPNIIDGRYNDVEHYLDIHFRLMREDMVSAFRSSIAEYKKKCPLTPSGSQKINIYHHVTVSYPPSYTVDGISHDIKFKNSVAVNWVASKKFLPGSVICLTSDDFKSVIFATIKKNDTPPGNRQECRFSVIIEDDKSDISPENVYNMIETTAYFESYRHVLTALKRLNEENFPLSDIITYLDYDDPVPDHLKNFMFCLHESCNCESLQNNDTLQADHPCKIFDVRKLEDWPSCEQLKLDPHQRIAFHTALIKKVALIQGPPGTGKTFLGLKIVKAILENVPVKPIVICCLTNHALDQFLNHILRHTTKVIRMGQQSKSESIEPYKMSNLLEVIRSCRYQGLSSLDTMDVKAQTSLKIANALVPDIVQFTPKVVKCTNYTQLVQACADINNYLDNFVKCTKKYMDVTSLNMIIDHNYKQILLEGAGSKADNLCISVKEWLCIKTNDDVYETCKSHWSKMTPLKKAVDECDSDDSELGVQVVKLWAIPVKKRFELFYCWRKKCLKILQNKLKEEIDLYHKYLENREKSLNTDISELMRGADIIGMTMTGAAKFKNYLMLIKPTVMIIEEAAEVLESHAISSLVPSIKHLILIGDHEQLRPIPADHDLAINYNLNISLFERLFTQCAPSSTLISQHRMRPCIAELLVPDIYQSLESHRSVYEYENIKGISHSMFFFKHCERENQMSFGTSVSNNFEASIIAQLSHYLFLLGYDQSKITILVMYAAQLLVIKQYLSQELSDIHVTTVDNYQGEENDIILISFVRSNPQGMIGFLKDSNRVCVALSRARKALFCVGDFDMFARRSKLWSSIVSKLESNNMIGNSFPLQCQIHKDTKLVMNASDFEEFLNSGCGKPCDYELPCGHFCTKLCHLADMNHTYFKCMEPCKRLTGSDKSRICKRLCSLPCLNKKKKIYVNLPCGHTAASDVMMIDHFFESYKCEIESEKCLPCGHHDTIPCFVNLNDHKCTASVSVILNCGHRKQVPCYQKNEHGVVLCCELVPYIAPCGHTVEVPCDESPEESILLAYCTKSCDTLLTCGHACTGLCNWCFNVKIHSLCVISCEQLLSCGHNCKGTCGAPCLPCDKKCSLSCPHTYCVNPCLKPCIECMKPCTRSCIHQKCSNPCYMMCNVPPCKEQCFEELECGHECIGLCGDPCPVICRICDEELLDSFDYVDPINGRYVMLEDCDHVIEEKALTLYIRQQLDVYEWPSCLRCNTVITRSNRYSDELKKAKEFCLKNENTNEQIQYVSYLSNTMFGEDCFVMWQFQDVHNRIQQILMHGKPSSAVLAVLRNCIMCLRDLVIINKKIYNYDSHIENLFETLILWICNHLEMASFQQLEELEASVSSLKIKANAVLPES